MLGEYISKYSSVYMLVLHLWTDVQLGWWTVQSNDSSVYCLDYMHNINNGVSSIEYWRVRRL